VGQDAKGMRTSKKRWRQAKKRDMRTGCKRAKTITVGDKQKKGIKEGCRQAGDSRLARWRQAKGEHHTRCIKQKTYKTDERLAVVSRQAVKKQ
jgi:hypothetical protein